MPPNLKTEREATRRYLGYCFEEWMLKYQFRWDKKTGGYVIPIPDPFLKGEHAKPKTKIIQQPQPPPKPSALTPRLTTCPAVSSSPGSLPPSIVTSIPLSAAVPETPLFTTDCFEVRRSQKGGYGAFAIKDIDAGTVVIAEKPLVKSDLGSIFFNFESLSQDERNEYLKLHGFKKLNSNRVLSIFMTNRFEISKCQGAIFPRSSRFNHACPEFKACSYSYDKVEDSLVTTAHRDIKAGDEITISYASKPNELLQNYGFKCDCPACKR